MAELAWQLVADDRCSVSLGSQAEAAVLAAALRHSGAWLDVVCGRESVHLQFDLSKTTGDAVLVALESFVTPPGSLADSAGTLDIPACYDPAVAPDLDATCEQLGLSMDEFVQAHTSSTHEVAMLGFMPGFAYINGLDPSLLVDRLDQPRQHVDAGTIGIAGSQTGIYPFDGPGGWRLVARTPLKLFDPAKSPPALLQPMQKVRFVPITLDELEAFQ